MNLFPTRSGNRGLYPSFFDNNDWFENFNVSQTMKTDIRETDDAYILEAEVPGFEKDKINIDYHNNVLTISGKEERESGEQDKESGNYIRRERSVQSFNRQFLIQDIKADEIKAEYKDGLLTINLPKENPEEQKARKIEIE